MKDRSLPLIMVVYGTRPEGIKVAPVVHELRNDPRFRVITVVTGQHRQMLDEVGSLFGITPDLDLDVFETGQSLNRLSAKIINRLDGVLAEHRPDALLVQGDTTTVAMAALAAFNARIPVIHLEAGLRSGDLSQPFPEEGNRRLVSQIARLHLAPTVSAKRNLLREGISETRIAVTGNTVVDALHMIIDSSGRWKNREVEGIVASGQPLVTVTSHRRENWGEPQRSTARAVRRLALESPDTVFVLPLHANPEVGKTFADIVGDCPNVIMVPPLQYSDFLRLVKASTLVLSDSGGVQEESPSLRTPVLILRETTERPEAVASGWASLVGTDEDAVYDAATHILAYPSHVAQARRGNPFGDGFAARRCVAAIADLTGVGDREADYDGEEEQ